VRGEGGGVNIKHEFMVGTFINHAALELCAAANHDGQTHETGFNGITIVAKPDDTAEDVVRRYHEASERHAEEYRNSPAGKKAARETEERRLHAQSEVTRLLRALDSLDWSTHHAPLRWWREFTEHADHLGVTVPPFLLLGAFNAHGYASGVNCGRDFRKDDPDNVARWIVGQCLDMTEKVGGPHPVTEKFITEWLQSNAEVAA
jgi:hypothetical protein